MGRDKILDKINKSYKPYKKRAIIFAIIVVVYVIGRLQGNAGAATLLEINTYTDAVAEFYDIPDNLLQAIITVESSYDKYAVSHKDAYGLMQVTLPAYQDYLRYNPSTYITNFDMIKNDWRANIAVGAWYIKRFCYKNTGNWRDALTAYNWGLSHPAPTLAYYKKVRNEIL